MAVKLFPYQESAVRQLSELDSGLLLDQMGLGKTIQTIEFVQRKGLKPCLLIPPKSLVYNWFDEICKWYPEEEELIVIFENPEQFLDIYFNDKLEGKKAFYIAWHDVLARNDDLVEQIMNLEWNCVVLDEAHLFRNMTTKRTRRLMKLKGDGFRLALTGTPTVNSAMDLYPLLKFTKVDVPEPKEFINRFTHVKQTNFGPKPMGFKNQAEMKELIGDKWIRRTKAQVLKDLPEKSERELRLEMAPKQRRLYESMLSDLVVEFEGGGINAPNILSYLLRLRQLALDPALIIPAYDETASKTAAVIDLVNSTDSKLVVFTNFETYVKRLGDEFDINRVKYVRLTGKESAEERIENVREFQRNDKIKVFLSTMQAGGVGITLTAAEITIITDLWWNKVRVDQAIDRIHRIGQTRKVQAIILHCLDSIDDYIKQITLEKDATAQDLIKAMIEKEIAK